MNPDNRKCKYDTMAPPINKDAQTKCVTCDENNADNPEAYEACLKYPVESVNPTTICESTAGCALVETEIEERKWENGNEDFVKSTNAVQRVCKDDIPLDLDMNRIKIREEVSQCRGDLCNKRRFEVDPVCLPSITTASPTTDATTTDLQTSTSLTTPSSTVTTPTVIQTTTSVLTKTTTATTTTTTATTTLLTTPYKTTTTLKSTTKSEQATGSLTSSQTPSTTTTDPKTSTADSSLKTTVASLTTQAFLTAGATTLSLLPDQEHQQTTVSLAIIGTIIGTFVTIFIIMIAIRRR